MKRIIAFSIAVIMLFSLCACAGDSGKTSDVSSQELLTTVWDSVAEADKFPVVGGVDASSVEGAPGAYPIDNAEELDRVLAFPAAEVGKLDSAACLIHGMMANNFTVGAFDVKDGEDTAALAEALKSNLLSRQWMCGFPDRILVAYVGDCLIGAFGLNDQLDIFKAQLEANYEDVVIVSEAPIA